MQPRVLNAASLAALVSALACYPRLTLWLQRPGPVWYLEATVFIGCTVLWGFVFAWHEPYTHRPVFVFPVAPGVFAAATGLGIGAALATHFWLDPQLRPQLPQEYPADWRHWLAAVPFALAFNQLFLVCAPFDCLIRLTRSRRAATILTGVLAAGLVALRAHLLPQTFPPTMWALVMMGRFTSGCLLAEFYVRGGVLLVAWWTFLLEARHVLNFF
jgi:hypothetical protein